MKGRKYLDALCVYFWATTPVLISILTFTTYALMGNKLTAAKVFTYLVCLLMKFISLPILVHSIARGENQRVLFVIGVGGKGGKKRGTGAVTFTM